MKKFILGLLLSAFVFVTVHDYVIGYVDKDTQTELVLVESGQLQSSAMCDSSKVHQHLHESLIACQIFSYVMINRSALKQNNIAYNDTLIPNFTPKNLYRPPIA